MINRGLVELWPFAHGGPVANARLKAHADDFIVREKLSFIPDGQGTHAFLFIRKRGLTTDELIKRIQRQLDVPRISIGYAGLKDKHAVTEQWISIDVQGKGDLAWQSLEDAQIQILDVTRNTRKLKIGALRGNCFDILLRDITGDATDIDARVAAIAKYGVPNYFGEQRFGRDGDNAERAEKFFAGEYRPHTPHERGMLLSAARSIIFNRVLARRVQEGSWNGVLSGDVMMLAGTHSVFAVDQVDDTLRERVKNRDISPTGPLWGAGALMTLGGVAALENSVATLSPRLIEGLTTWQLRQERRRLVLFVEELRSAAVEAGIRLNFCLESGAYATTVVREIVQTY